MESAVEGVDGAGDNHCRQAGVELFGAANQLVTIHLRHQEVAEDQIEGSGEGSLKNLKRLLCRARRDDAVATGFEKEGAD